MNADAIRRALVAAKPVALRGLATILDGAAEMARKEADRT